MEDQQDSAALDFAATWRNAKSLNICEVEQLLRIPFLQGEASGTTKPHLEMAFTHARRFARLKDTQALQELRMALEDWEAPSNLLSSGADGKLAGFEQAQLVNLLPADPDEAVVLIPSLKRFAPIDITSAIDVINSFTKSTMGAQDSINPHHMAGPASLHY